MRIYVDMDDTLVEYSKARDLALQLNPNMPYPQSQYGFFLNLKPTHFAQQALAALVRAGHDVWIATAPSVKNPMCYTEKVASVRALFGEYFAKRTIIIPNKSLLDGDILIDDTLSGRGQENFKGKLMLYGSPKYSSWYAILSALDIKV